MTQTIPPGSARVNPADAIVEALGGDPRTGMACCPAHADDTPSLHVEQVNGKILLHCHAGCSQAAVLDELRALGLWPVSGTTTTAKVTPRRSDDERREFALKIISDTRANRGVELAEFLDIYFAKRGIVTVPATAMLALPENLDPYGERRLIPDCPAMIFGVTDGHQLIGAHVTWLSPDLETKQCGKEPARQFFGPVGGGYIPLFGGDLKPTDKLIIAEGVETAMAAAQIAGGLPAIAGLSATNLPKIIPPRAPEYIVACDHDAAGLRGARALAAKLTHAGFLVRLAIPPTPGDDWNDVLLKLKTQKEL